MPKLNVIFNRPVRIGKNVYPKSLQAVEVDIPDADYKNSPFYKGMLKSGEMVIVGEQSAEAQKPAAPAPKGK